MKFRCGGSSPQRVEPRTKKELKFCVIANYEFYRETYFGDQLTEENFEKYATRADSFLNELTMGRYACDRLRAEDLKAVKMAECAIADLCLNLEQATLQSDAAWKVQGEKVGNHTVTYRNNADIAKQTETQIREVARRYLCYTGLLYRGIPTCTHRM
jgi:hypothetical protein